MAEAGDSEGTYIALQTVTALNRLAIELELGHRSASPR
jgi:hypothetical protein